MLLCYYMFISYGLFAVAYNNIHKLPAFNEQLDDVQNEALDVVQFLVHNIKKSSSIKGYKQLKLSMSEQKIKNHVTNRFSGVTNRPIDPFKKFHKFLHRFLFGHKIDATGNDYKIKTNNTPVDTADILAYYPSGNIMRADRFDGQSGVHLPITDYLQSGHCRLNMTRDFMQTAIDAFSIFLEGDLEDILHLPALYVLRSARTIAMMRITREKLAATWIVVKGEREADEVSYHTLELYRPLFKYLNGREMARLNLSDDRIVSYIGTHAELNRHQVGVVASKYIKINENWSEPRYLNIMNNLLCGVPMSFMRKIPENTYLQLTHQIFYHIRACDPLQRRFYLSMMTRTKALGKSYSWSARDVARLGLLLAEVEGRDLSAINPKAMSGITAHVMLEMSPQNLQYLTEMQLRYIGQKPLNILARKLKMYQDELRINNHGRELKFILYNSFVIMFLFLN